MRVPTDNFSVPRIFDSSVRYRKSRSVRTSIAVLLLLVCLTHGVSRVFAVDSCSYISTKDGEGCFPLSASGRPAPLFVDADDFPGVIRVMKHLQNDIALVTGTKPVLSADAVPLSPHVILSGTLGKSPIIDRLAVEKKLDITGIAGRWETFLLQVVDAPLPGVDRALIIAGSDKRGTIYGIYDLSTRIGVSPWYWWADVPVRRQSDLYVLPGRHSSGEPAVKYRGIFINDEAPALSGWVHEKFGGFNSRFYEKVFELILRLKGNYLWPAMWGRAFYVDDPLNPQLADEYGIVIGTSHHEPMMRAHAEWNMFGSGAWNYDANEETLREFWRQGIERMNSYESIVTIGMRGDGDEPMSEESNIALLERIVADQRAILEEVTGKDASVIPQKWALYKEVQDYYDKGMRVPDDVTLLLCDDNWGNIRKLPQLNADPRSGGYGIYYHFDYVGGPRNYKWLNTNPIARVWEQMHLAYRYGVDRIWIVNVGDIKPMEFPIQFFLEYAWDPDVWPAERLPEFSRLWAEQQFGNEHAAAIADILTRYTMYNSRRKPELLAPDTYSLVNYLEAETVVAEYNALAERADGISSSLPMEYRGAFYQLVLFPVKACANLNDLYVTVGKNRLYARQGRSATDALAERAKALFKKDAELTDYYNKNLAGGKWNHMMDQTHIGYTYWQQPDKNVMPKVEEIHLPAGAEMAVAIEGSEFHWPAEESRAVLPGFDPFNRQIRYIDVFNRGQTAFDFSIESDVPWLVVSPAAGRVDTEQRLGISVDWQAAPFGRFDTQLRISGPENRVVVVHAVVNNPVSREQESVTGFIESDSCISIEAEHYSRAVNVAPVRWQRIPDLGRTLSAMTAFPVTAARRIPGGNSPRLEYDLFLFTGGAVKIRALVSPTLDFHNSGGLCYGISIDEEPPQIINIHADFSFQDWEEAVRRNVIAIDSEHNLDRPGAHVLKFWMVDPGVVLQKLIVETGKIAPCYLGPPESAYRN